MIRRSQNALFVFRRDLRLADNTALIAALERSEYVLPCFIFDPRQVEAHPYRSEAALQFMLESLEDLQNQLLQAGGRLFCFFGRADEIIGRLLEVGLAQTVFLNRDYTPFSRERDAQIAQAARRHGAEFFEFDDVLLNAPGSVLKADGSPYCVFTPFFKAAGRLQVPLPRIAARGNFYTGEVEFEYREEFSRILESRNDRSFAHGGRREALRILDGLQDLKDYRLCRDYPALRGTSGLSPHLKFGTCSVREAFQAVVSKLGPAHEIVRQLYWRDFFSHIAWHFPHVFGQAYNRRFSALEWQENNENFDRWCRGETGFPIVDAGMRELNTTGFMHNRVRMIAGSFLVKDLHIDWRRGEKYFASRLVDYDPAVNNGNWQWVASTGCDAQPWFRIFNPWLQQKKFDPQCLYIKRWLPEVAALTPGMIHNLHQDTAPAGTVYPVPCVDHLEEKSVSEDLFEKAHSDSGRS